MGVLYGWVTNYIDKRQFYKVLLYLFSLIISKLNGSDSNYFFHRIRNAPYQRDGGFV